VDLLDITYIINFILLVLASITDIREKIIPHKYTIAMIVINLAVGYYYFGTDAIIAFFSTLILCLILSIGMGGGDVKLFTALAPIFAYPDTFVFDKYKLYIDGVDAGSNLYSTSYYYLDFPIELIDNRTLFKSSRYNIKYLNLRRKLIGSYDTFLDSITTIENSKLQEKLSAELNLGIFRLNSEIFEAIKEKEIDIFEALINEFKKSKKRNVFIIDEIQTLEDIYINGSRELLKEFLNFCVRLTKELHLSHVVILTSNTIFLNRIYNDAKLKATSIFKFIDHPKEDIATKLLVDLGYSTHT